MPLEAFWRSLMSGAYSGESYHVRACAIEGNSSTTMRFGVQPPSLGSTWPPRGGSDAHSAVWPM